MSEDGWAPGAPGLPDQARSSAESAGLPFQKRVVNWLMACFSMEICRDGIERNHRFLEEALELVQSLDCTRSEAHQLVDYVFNRPIGEPKQELGGTLVTLTALANCHDMDMMEAGETELARVWTKIDKIRAKQAAKPKHSPLPQHVPDAAQSAQVPTLIELAIEREEKYLHDLIDDEAVGSVMHGDIEGAFHRLNEALTSQPSPAATVETKSAPELGPSQNNAERLPSSDAAGSGAGTQCSAGTEDVRWAVNYLLEQIAAKFEAWETFDLFSSEAAATVRSFKYDLIAHGAQNLAQDAEKGTTLDAARVTQILERRIKLDWLNASDGKPDIVGIEEAAAELLRDEPQAVVGWEFVSKDGEHGILTKNHEHAREWVRRGHEARPVVYSSQVSRPNRDSDK